MNEVKLILGDALDVLRDMEAGSVSAVVTDPPYNVGLDYSNGDKRPDYAEWCKQWLSESLRVAQCVIFTPGIANVCLYPQPEWILCWNKKFSGTRGGRIAVVNRWEPIFVYGFPQKIGGDMLEAMSDCYLSNHKNGIYDTENHPCPKPLQLMRQLVRMVEPGALILDPFLGSGTTAVAAILEGRRAIGIEIDPTYYAIAEKRIAQAQAQPPLIPHEAHAQPVQHSILEAIP